MVNRKEKSLEDVPANPTKFFPWLKRASEQYWHAIPLKDGIFGFQIQAGTTWNPGLTSRQIADYEAAMGFTFPQIFKQYLAVMNGTNKDTVNIYGRCGEPHRYAPGYYAYPRDLGAVKEKIQWIYGASQVTPDEVETNQIPHIIPIVAHRFLVVDRCPTNPVLSMYGDDIIPYSSNLMTFLVDDIFHASQPDPHLPADLSVKFWLER